MTAGCHGALHDISIHGSRSYSGVYFVEMVSLQIVQNTLDLHMYHVHVYQNNVKCQ